MTEQPDPRRDAALEPDEDTSDDGALTTDEDALQDQDGEEADADDPYTEGFDGVQDPMAEPEQVEKAEARTEAADDA